MNNKQFFCKSNFFGLESDLINYSAVNFFSTPETKLHFVPSHEVEPEHIKIELELDFEKEIVKGSTQLNVVVKNPEISQITLDAKSLVIENVLVNNEEVEFENSGKKLLVLLPAQRQRGEKLTLKINHFVEKPAAGAYFIKPSTDYPDKHVHLWTQSQDEDASYFFPCFDHPSFKQTSEVIVNRVPSDMIVLSNGTLIAKTDSSYHYKLDIPHSTYLITVVVGNFIEVKDEWNGIPISFYVHPSRVDDGHRAFDKTAKMVQFFSEFTGVRYPYPKYSQIAVSDFIFGGMENTTATTQTDRTLHDERAHLDFSSDGLVAHELAHQWFGDLLTCKEWSHAWLNESFATYFQALFFEYDLGKDEFDYDMLSKAETYFNEDANDYRRSIVFNKYSEPIDLFDSHLYPGGAWRLHMLRQMFGTEEFKKVMQYYVEKHKFQNVETVDLQRAFEKVTGKNVDLFFDQWLYKSGYPSIEFEFSWEKKTNLAKFIIKQTQDTDKGQLFTFDTEIKLLYEDQTEKHIPISISQKEITFYFSSDKKPLFASFDPHNSILKNIVNKSNRKYLKNQILHDKEIIGRIYAIRSLIIEPSTDTIQFLGERLKKEPFWGVQAQIAKSIGSVSSNISEDYLISALTLEHPKARRAVVSALQNFPNSSKAKDALTKMIKDGDASYYVESEICKTLGLLKDPSLFELLKNQLQKESHNDVIKQGVLEGLSGIVNENSFNLLVEWTKPGKPVYARLNAITSLAKVGKRIKSDETFDLLAVLSQENNFRIKMAIISAFKILGNKKAFSFLNKFQEQEADGRFQKASFKAKTAIQEDLTKPQELDSLRDEISKLREENKQIRDSLEKLQAKNN